MASRTWQALRDVGLIGSTVLTSRITCQGHWATWLVGGCRMIEKKYEIAETPQGIGKVYRGDDWLADVRYRLLVEQEFTFVRYFLGTRERPGPKVVVGQITVVESERLSWPKKPSAQGSAGQPE